MNTIYINFILFDLTIIFFILDYFFFNCRSLKKLRELVEMAKKASDNCYLTLTLIVLSSIALIYFIKAEEYLSTAKIFVVCIFLQFIFDNCNNTKKVVFLCLYGICLGCAFFYSFNLLLEVFCFWLGAYLLKSPKKEEYTFAEWYLFFYIVCMAACLLTSQESNSLPHSLWEVFRSLTSYCMEEDVKSTVEKTVSKDEGFVKTAALVGTAAAFLSCSKSIREARFGLFDHRVFRMQNCINYYQFFQFQAHSSRLFFCFGVGTAFLGAGNFVQHTVNSGLDALQESVVFANTPPSNAQSPDCESIKQSQSANDYSKKQTGLENHLKYKPVETLQETRPKVSVTKNQTFDLFEEIKPKDQVVDVPKKTEPKPLTRDQVSELRAEGKLKCYVPDPDVKTGSTLLFWRRDL